MTSEVTVVSSALESTEEAVDDQDDFSDEEHSTSTLKRAPVTMPENKTEKNINFQSSGDYTDAASMASKSPGALKRIEHTMDNGDVKLVASQSEKVNTDMSSSAINSDSEKKNCHERVDDTHDKKTLEFQASGVYTDAASTDSQYFQLESTTEDEGETFDSCEEKEVDFRDISFTSDGYTKPLKKYLKKKQPNATNGETCQDDLYSLEKSPEKIQDCSPEKTDDHHEKYSSSESVNEILDSVPKSIIEARSPWKRGSSLAAPTELLLSEDVEVIYDDVPHNCDTMSRMAASQSADMIHQLSRKEGSKSLDKRKTRRNKHRTFERNKRKHKTLTPSSKGKDVTPLLRKKSASTPQLADGTNDPVYYSPSAQEENHEEDSIYESVEFSAASSDNSDEWGSSEFEEYSSGHSDIDQQSKPLPPKPKKSIDDTAAGALLKKFKSFTKGKYSDSDEDNLQFRPVELNPEKHPPPALPEQPANITEIQMKKRRVVDCIIQSEKSYITTLERLIFEYEKPLLETYGLSRSSKVKSTMKKIHEILYCHRMFQIELAAAVSCWDENEEIGNIFTASFSKDMVLDAYSVFVNNFSSAMDTIKKEQRNKQSFREFLKLREVNSTDRLSIFGLMVKPVQRFPQFIMFIQDLLHYTPQDHHDRKALQLALTELENVAHRLNERKRASEQEFQAKQLFHQLPIPRFLLERSKSLIRHDNFQQLVNSSKHGLLKTKSRRLLVMNDSVICIDVSEREEDGSAVEKYRYKWSIPIRSVELKETVITPDMLSVIKGDPGKLSIMSRKIDKINDDPYDLFNELNDLLHDYAVVGQVSALMASLKRTHQVSQDMIQDMSCNIQKRIQLIEEHIQIVNSCSTLTLSMESKAGDSRFIFQASDPYTKHNWCLDFLMTKLALEPMNNPSWDISSNTAESNKKKRQGANIPALLVRCVQVDLPRHFTKVQCAVPVFLSSVQTGNIGIQHLWVCSATEMRGQVSVVSIHSSKPSLLESFKATNSRLLCAETIPGFATIHDSCAFEEDTIWMATAKSEIVVHSLQSQNNLSREPVAVFQLADNVLCMKYAEDDKIFAGLDCGALAMFSRNEDTGVWVVEEPRIFRLGREPVVQILIIEDTLWAACGGSIFSFCIETLELKVKHCLSSDIDNCPIQQMTQVGVGLWVAFQNQSVIRLYHIESLDLLQEINVLSSVNRVVSGKLIKSPKFGETQKGCYVSCIIASRGMLWIGTNLGLVLTLPLPRLKGGVPKVNGRPSVALHGHRGPVQFLLPIYCASKYLDKSIPSSIEKSASCYSIYSKAVKTDRINASPMCDIPNPDNLVKTSASKNIKSADNTVTADCNEDHYYDVPDKDGQSTSNKMISSQIDKHKSSKTEKMTLLEQTTHKKAQTLKRNTTASSFQTELNEKLKTKRSLSNPEVIEADDRSQNGEVELLYQNLLETGVHSSNNSLNQSAPQSIDRKRSSSNPKLQNLKFFRNKNVSAEEDLINPSADTTKSKSTGDSSGPSVTRQSSVSSQHNHNNASESVKSKADRKPTMDKQTLKRNWTNAVIVVSGGDGYCNWNKDSVDSWKSDDACLMMWLYKF